MKANDSYFKRMQGAWVFDPSFKILSWKGLFHSDATLLNKFRLAALVAVQNLFGKYQMKTRVHFNSASNQISHTTVVSKFGMEILRSEKIFHLDHNGFDLLLEGNEFYWPLTCVPLSFPKMNGRVEANATRAQYKMPLAGMPTHCESVMEEPQAFIKISLPWFEGIFNFTAESMNVLNARPLPN